MSKAFTRDDDGGADPVVVPGRAPLPAGTVNYVTPRGLAALRLELDQLSKTRAELATTSSDAERARSTRALQSRIRDLEERLATATVVNVNAQARDEVRFGARVTVRSESGGERAYEIVGVDEADASSGRVAFVAPVARALLGKRVGDAVTLRTPRGEEELEVVAID